MTALVMGCSDNLGLPDAQSVIDAPEPGRLSLSWTLGHDGVPLSCTDVGAGVVSVQSINVDAAAGVVDPVPCASASGTTRLLAPGTYNVQISLVGGAGTLAGPIVLPEVVIEPGQTVELAPVAFDVDPHGAFTFHLVTRDAEGAPTQGNCVAADQGGAGIAATRIELFDDDQCQPTTFSIGAGATLPAGTYHSDCAAESYVCIAEDQLIEAAGVASGARRMILTGVGADSSCWSKTVTFRVSGAGLTTVLNPQPLQPAETCPSP